MIYLQVKLSEWFIKLYNALVLYVQVLFAFLFLTDQVKRIWMYIRIVGVESLSIVLLTAYCMGMLLSFQITKELISIKAICLVGSMVTTTLVREISPMLTAIILTGRIGSAFTAELATMIITEQINVLYILNIDPVLYLVVPRVCACVCMLPLLNVFSVLTSVFSSILVAYILYDVEPYIFLNAVFLSLFTTDLICSCSKAVVFGCVISIVSCSWGLSSLGSSKKVGESTTSAVVTILLFIFSFNFILSYFMFSSTSSVISM